MERFELSRRFEPTYRISSLFNHYGFCGFFRIAFRLFCPPKTIAVSRYFGIHPWKKLDFSRGSNESQKRADFGSFVRIRVRNVRTMLEQHSIHRCFPPNKWQRCMLWKTMTLIGQKCRIFWLRNRCACFAIAANEQHSITLLEKFCFLWQCHELAFMGLDAIAGADTLIDKHQHLTV